MEKPRFPSRDCVWRGNVMPNVGGTSGNKITNQFNMNNSFEHIQKAMKPFLAMQEKLRPMIEMQKKMEHVFKVQKTFENINMIYASFQKFDNPFLKQLISFEEIGRAHV